MAVITLTGGNGPAECSTGPKIGSTVTYQIAIQRSGDTLRVILDPHNFPTDHWADYDGTAAGDDVTVSGHYYGMDLCGGGNVQGLINYGFPAQLTGTLVDEGRGLKGKELRTAIANGQLYTYEYTWSASSR